MAAEGVIRVAVVDDHAVVRSGLGAFLLAYDDLALAGEAENGVAAVELCRRTRPDVVLMDLVMPEMDGATATRLIRQECPRSQVIVLTSFREENLVREALASGAMGYLLKNASADDLARAIREAHAGRPVLAPEAVQALVQSPKATLGDDLTARERDVLALLVQGLENPEIARRLVVSRSTVKFHVSSILAKLGAHSRTEAVSLALQHRLVG